MAYDNRFLPASVSTPIHSIFTPSISCEWKQMAYEIPLRSPGVPALSVTSYPVEKRLVPENPRE